jgi:hypothetical protein
VRSLVPVFAVLVLLAACREPAYTTASKRDTPAAWREFLASSPDDERVPEARERLAGLELAQARAVHSVLAYKRFLEEFGDTDAAPAARKLLEGLRYNAAQEKGTAQALRQFLSDHPDGAHRAEVEQQLVALELREVLAGGDATALAAATTAHPDDPRAEAAQLKLDDVAFSEARTASAWLAYLADFPAGKHRDEARAQLVSLELEGLLASGDVRGARALASTSPLARGLPGLAARFTQAEGFAALEASTDLRVRRALASHTRRALDDLLKSLSAPDAMDRWQAAEELGFTASVHAIDPLLEAFRAARLPAIRRRALESLGRVLRALPRPVAEYEVAVRRTRLEAQAGDAQLQLSLAVLFDLTGRLDRAAAEYQRAWDAAAPDPVVLDRWAGIRLERRQFYSAAVAARQLALWADGVLAAQGPVSAEAALWTSRERCGALELARRAEAVIAAASSEKTEFPEDLEVFLRKARDTRRLAEARLRDAELQLLTADPRARTCGDEAVAERMAAGQRERLASLSELAAKPPKAFPLLLEYVAARDPDPVVRDAARALQAPTRPAQAR